MGPISLVSLNATLRTLGQFLYSFLTNLPINFKLWIQGSRRQPIDHALHVSDSEDNNPSSVAKM